MSPLKEEAYPSSEDTFLLLDALKEDSSRVSNMLGAGGLILEVGYVYSSHVYLGYILT